MRRGVAGRSWGSTGFVIDCSKEGALRSWFVKLPAVCAAGVVVAAEQQME